MIKKTQAFTLIELLTVIAIIGILAGILIPTLSAVRDAAKKSTTKSQFSQWSSAMGLFKQEYGYYPSIATANLIDSDKFFPALTGKKRDGTAASIAELLGNKKRLSFYSAADSDVASTARGYSAADAGKIIDGFGNIEIGVYTDTNGDGLIDDSPVAVECYDNEASVTPVLPADGVRAGVIFYSAGNGEGDAVTSW